jgi:hypothetical protein
LKTKNKKSTGPKKILLVLATFTSNLLIYIFQFIVDNQNADYFLCTSLQNYTIEIFSNNLTFIYPFSCDFPVYAEGILNFSNFYDLDGYVYTNRPLFIFSIYIFYTFLSTVFSAVDVSSIIILHGSFYLAQLLLTVVIAFLIYRLLISVNLQVGNKVYLIPFFISLSPIFKWHVFESTSMTYTFLIFLLGLFTYPKKNLNLYFFSFGLITLIHRSAILIIIFLIAYELYSKKLNKHFLKSLPFYVIPIIVYYATLFFYGKYSDFNADYYRQFVWVLDYFKGVETRSSGYYCQTPKYALKCYFIDFVKTVKYLAIPTIYVIAILLNKFMNLATGLKVLIYKAISFTFLINLFWLFIGWYPPVRFTYYGYGNLVIFLLIISFFLLNNLYSKASFLMGYGFYFMFLNHWNHPLVINYDSYIYLSIVFFLFSGAIENFYNKRK